MAVPNPYSAVTRFVKYSPQTSMYTPECSNSPDLERSGSAIVGSKWCGHSARLDWPDDRPGRT